MRPGRNRGRRIEIDPRVSTTTIVALPEAGQVEIARTSDGDYWLHITVYKQGGEAIDGRIDYKAGTPNGAKPVTIAAAQDVEHVALRVRHAIGGQTQW